MRFFGFKRFTTAAGPAVEVGVGVEGSNRLHSKRFARHSKKVVSAKKDAHPLKKSSERIVRLYPELNFKNNENILTFSAMNDVLAKEPSRNSFLQSCGVEDQEQFFKGVARLYKRIDDSKVKENEIKKLLDACLKSEMAIKKPDGNDHILSVTLFPAHYIVRRFIGEAFLAPAEVVGDAGIAAKTNGNLDSKMNVDTSKISESAEERVEAETIVEQPIPGLFSANERRELLAIFVPALSQNQVALTANPAAFHILEDFFHNLNQSYPEELKSFLIEFKENLKAGKYPLLSEKPSASASLFAQILLSKNADNDVKNNIVKKFVEADPSTLAKRPRSFALFKTIFGLELPIAAHEDLKTYIAKIASPEKMLELLKEYSGRRFLEFVLESPSAAIKKPIIDSDVFIEAKHLDAVYNGKGKNGQTLFMFFLYAPEDRLKKGMTNLFQDKEKALEFVNFACRRLAQKEASGIEKYDKNHVKIFLNALDENLVAEFPTLPEGKALRDGVKGFVDTCHAFEVTPRIEEYLVRQTEKAIQTTDEKILLQLERVLRGEASESSKNITITVLKLLPQLNRPLNKSLEEFVRHAFKTTVLTSIGKEPILAAIISDADSKIVKSLLELEFDAGAKALLMSLVTDVDYGFMLRQNDFGALKPRSDEANLFKMRLIAFAQVLNYIDSYEVPPLKDRKDEKVKVASVRYDRILAMFTQTMRFYPGDVVDAVLDMFTPDRVMKGSGLMRHVLREVHQHASLEKQKAFLAKNPDFVPVKPKARTTA